MPKYSLRTIRMTLLTVLAFLVSGVSSADPSMAFQISSSAHHQSMMSSPSTTDHTPNAHHSMAKSNGYGCDGWSGLQDCCNVTCISALATLPAPITSLTRSHLRAPVPHDLPAIKIKRQTTLYRPPIV